MAVETCTLKIGGMTCASCVRTVEKALSKTPGVRSASVNYAAETAAVRNTQVKAPESPAAKARPAKPKSTSEPGLSPLDLKALSEIRAMYRRLPPERLVAICKRPPRGMEKLFAVLAREIGVEPGQPQGP